MGFLSNQKLFQVRETLLAMPTVREAYDSAKEREAINPTEEKILVEVSRQFSDDNERIGIPGSAIERLRQAEERPPQCCRSRSNTLRN